MDSIKNIKRDIVTRKNTRTGFLKKIKKERYESQMEDNLKIANDFLEFWIIQGF